ncbi:MULTISPECIES: ABC transporter substrate-binding protein [Amycolatopsis]|uniref:ABC transporter substrate-binding protein n=1 Tax=Amycolatopsis dongchuanensis TaxID=1070866 RepID=A0ABP8VKJ5_9PSEU
MFSDRRLERRTFLRAAGATGVLAGTGLASTFLAGCGSTGGGGTGKVAAGLAPAATALQPGKSIEGTIFADIASQLPRGGTLDITLTQSAATLNILSSTLVAIQWYADPAHDTLERFDQHGNLVPSLAQKVELVNPTTYRYTLHEANFHNGRKVVAQDVVDTVEYVRNPTLGSNRAGTFKGVTVRAIDEGVVEFVLPEPNMGFRYYLPGLPIVPVETAGQLADNPIGCGPYRFKEWVKDSHIDYEANREYWNRDLPRLDKLRLTLRTDRQAATQAMQAGQTDLLDTVPPAQIQQFEQLVNAGKVAGATYTSGWSYIGLNTRKGPLRDPRVRRALALAVDRTSIARVNGGKYSTPVCTAPYPPESPEYPKDLDYSRDLNTARSLLEQAGASSLKLEILTTNAATVAIATVVKSNWKDIGVEAQITQIDVPTWVARRTRGDFEVGLSGWFSSREPSYVLDNLFTSNGLSNFWGYQSATADALIKQGRTTFDPNARRDVYLKLLKLLFIDEPPLIPLTSDNNFMVFRPGVNGADIAPTALTLWRYAVAAKRNA